MSENLRLLSLDGGGVRGLASLYMLRKILSFVGSPKPCNYFDMICGTSTGGLIAIMLGRLEMSVDQCIEAYTGMMHVVFNPKDKKKLPFKISSGKVQPQYKTKYLEQAIKQVISNAGLSADDRFRGEKKFHCKTVVIALTKESRVPIRFTDYSKPGEHSNFYNEVRIWEVARATSAATSFFEPMSITHAGEPRCFLDAGIGSNNPITELYLEAMSQFKKSDDDFDKQIRVLVSIGTGKPALNSFGDKLTEVAKSIIAIAAETQETAKTFYNMNRRLANRGGYFRFNPPDLFEVGLDEANKVDVISSRTEAYGSEPETIEMVEKWVNAAGTEQSRVSSPAPSRLPKTPAMKLFYSLHGGSKYIKEDAPSYWQYLTLDSYYVYENIYNNCNPQDGKVTFRSFFKQFGPSETPSPSHIAETWSRLLHDKSDVRKSIHRKPFVMATLYMLHIESCVDVTKMVNIDCNRRELLKRFSKWVKCLCNGQCGREWNFVNDVGLSRERYGRGDCDLLKLFDMKNSWKLMFQNDRVRKLEATRRVWEAVI